MIFKEMEWLHSFCGQKNVLFLTVQRLILGVKGYGKNSYLELIMFYHRYVSPRSRINIHA